jgi:hypothetical protein
MLTMIIKCSNKHFELFFLNHFHATNALMHYKAGDIIADWVSLNLERRSKFILTTACSGYLILNHKSIFTPASLF